MASVLVTNAAGKPWRPDPDRARRRQFRRMERRLLSMLRNLTPAARGAEPGALDDLLRQARLGAEVLTLWVEGKGG
jgi:hypothetical protein